MFLFHTISVHSCTRWLQNVQSNIVIFIININSGYYALGSYGHSNAFIQDLQRPNSRVFQNSKIFFFRTFQEMVHSKHWLHEVKKCIYKIGYQCICIKVKRRKCNTWGCIILLQWTQIRPTTGSWLINTKYYRFYVRIPGMSMFSRTYAFFQDFPGLEFWTGSVEPYMQSNCSTDLN